MALPEQTCETCKKVFTRKNKPLKGGVFCSLACKKKKLDIVKICTFCGESFKVTASDSEKTYCSKSCYHTALSLMTKQVSVSKTCKQCGESFLVRTFREDLHPKEFCSMDCKKKSLRVTQSCEHCGKEFTKYKAKINPSLKQYCSRSCKIADAQITKTCETCGKKYSGPQSQMRSDFCSHKCFEGPRKKYVDPVTLTCEHCGTDFQRYASNLNIKNGTFCSKDCRRKFKAPKNNCEICGKKYRKKKQLAHGNFCSTKCKGLALHVTLSCAYCQKPFEVLKSQGGKYCSAVCTGLGQKNNLRLIAKVVM